MWVPNYEATLITVKDMSIAVARHGQRQMAPVKTGFYAVHTDSVLSAQQLKRTRARRTAETSPVEHEYQGTLRPVGS